MPSAEPVLPIVQGDWVAWKGDNASVQIGRVRQSYWDRVPGGPVCMDVVLYAPSGKVLGRTSPACGGPKSFEPSITFDDYWQRIEKPSFPLRAENTSIPGDKPGWVTLIRTFYHSDGLAAKPVRTVAKKQSSDRPRRSKVIYVPMAPTNRSDVDAAAMRRAAQELRDMAKGTGDAEFASHIRRRADVLDADADKIKPRFA